MSFAEQERIFLAALERPPARRAAFIVEACGDDAELLAQVRGLLASHDDADSADFLGGAALELPAGSLVGRTIDRYRVVRELGAGGMGTVYLAERADEAFTKQVALKVVRGLETREATARFHAERQTLARLEHPHISRLLDGGTTEGGRPYFVMEYVDGVRIDRHCDEASLDMQARVSLFLDVCAAVHYAHQNLVIHRDLKPGNVVVDRDGHVKLLDFGIAKALDADDGSTGDPTKTRMPFTPAYASPEQVSGAPVSTATDVYALGLMLYELLTGARPQRVDDSSSLIEIANVVCEQTPTRPSRAVEGDTPQATARRRSLVGDLDAILLKALRKEPERRYPSVAAFAEDLRAYLEQRPVGARPDSLGYRCNRFARRNRALVGASVLGIAALIGGLTVSTVLFLDAERARAEQERARIDAEATGSFLASLLESIDPDVAGSQDTALLKAVLDDAAVRLERDLAGSPAVVARLNAILGSTYDSIGEFDEATERIDAAIAYFGDPAHGGAFDDALADALVSRATLDSNLGEFERALRRLDEAESLDRSARRAGTARLVRARALSQLGRPDEAIAVLEPHLTLDDLDAHTLAESLRLTGRAHAIQQRHDEAIAHLERSVELHSESYGEEHYRVASSLNALGWALLRAGKLEQAERVHRRAGAIYREVLDTDHPDIASNLMNVATILQRRGAYAEAEPLFQEALERFVASYGPDHIDVAIAHNNLGFLYLQWERPAPAERSLRRAIETYRRSLGDEHVYVGICLQNIVKLYDARDRLNEIPGEIEQAWRILAASFGEDDSRGQFTRAALAVVRSQPGAGGAAFAEAERELLDAERILSDAGREDLAPRVRAHLAALYRRWGRPAEAADWHERAGGS